MKKTFGILFLLLILSSCTHLKMGMFMFHSNPTEKDPGSVSRGKVAFHANCVQCHGVNADGKGELASTLSNPPTDFTNPEYTKSPTIIAAHISYGKRSEMPPFVDELPESTIWDISNYLYSLQKHS